MISVEKRRKNKKGMQFEIFHLNTPKQVLAEIISSPTNEIDITVNNFF
jgi:hypothetical protein